MNTGKEPRTFAFFERYIVFAEKHTIALLAVLLLIAGGALAMTLRLELHTDMSELLPEQHPAVKAFNRLNGRQKSASNLVMLVHSPDQDANVKFAEAIRPELDKLVPSVFSEISYKPDTEIPEYASKWRWLYVDLKDLKRAEELLDRIIAKRSSPLMVDLDGDPEEELKELRQGLNKKLPVRNDSAHFMGKDGDTAFLGLMLWRGRDGLASRGDHETLGKVQQVVSKFDLKTFHPNMVVEYTGAIAEAIDEQNGIRDDLTIATLVCGFAVMLVIWLYFRRLALLLVIGAPAVLGLLLALTIASVTIHYLNINTAFLISIILGNGINSPIVLLARYGEERQKQKSVHESLGIAMSTTLLGTGAAMAAASVAYGSLLLTSFRGFNQFGLLGGAGMLLVWIVAFILVPPMVIFGERYFPGRLTPKRSFFLGPFTWFGKLAHGHPVGFAAVSLVLLAGSIVPLVRYVRDPLEWDFNNLRTDETPSQRLWNRMELLGMGDVNAGYIGNNAVLLVDKPEEADPVAAALRAKDAAKGKLHVLKEIRTYSSMPPKDQPEKLEILARVRQKIDKRKELLSKEEFAELAAWRPPEYLRVLTTADLPKQIREAFTETDGQQGRLIGIDADHETYYDWNGHDLLRMSDALTVEALGKTWTAASAATIFAGVLETIIADGPRVTIAALIGVLLLSFVAFGLRGAIPVIISIAIGIAWLGGILGIIHLKINFMNFVALPITLGVGADYAANIWARLKAEGFAQLPHVIADTGSAVALCSMTTIIGYSSLLMSHNRALRSFGKLADIGEVTCLLAALLAMPAIVALLARRARQVSGNPTT